jgi:endonuclease/exonuclease/phosphatase (EEP) superfamily protein YafD
VPGTWSFSHVTIKKEKKEFDIALVHTSAPVSPSFFNMREKQMDKLSEILQNYYTTTTQKNIMVIGDFNVAPWSP